MASAIAPLHDIESRILSLLGTIDSAEVDLLIDLLLRADATNGKEITLYVSSRGGNWIEGLKLIDTINLLRSPVTAVALGQVEGAGLVLLAASTKRVLFPHSLLSSAGLWTLPSTHNETRHPIGLHSVADSRQILLAKVLQQVEQAIAEMPGRIPSFLADPTQPPRLLNAEEALQFGIADAIVTGADRQLLTPTQKIKNHATHSTHHL
jgi:ATP-dependent Clp protease, protease subunit